MPQSDLQARLQEAIQLAQTGQRIEARRMLEEIVRADPNFALAWLWLATVTTEREERIRYLERTLILMPDHARAQEAYAQLTGKPFAPPEVPPAGGALDRTQRISPSFISLFVVIAGVIVLVMVGLLLSGALKTEEPAPTATPTRVFFTPTRTPGPSPTPTWTPLPTHTPGPSPTSIWNAPPPTWTPSVTRTPAPTSTPRPTSTPSLTPTVTDTPDVAATEAAAAEAAATHAVATDAAATEMALAAATQTAEFALTSDGTAAD